MEILIENRLQAPFAAVANHLLPVGSTTADCDPDCGNRLGLVEEVHELIRRRYRQRAVGGSIVPEVGLEAAEYGDGRRTDCHLGEDLEEVGRERPKAEIMRVVEGPHEVLEVEALRGILCGLVRQKARPSG